MKTLRLSFLVVALVAFAFTAHAADKAPGLPIETALKLALDYLKGKSEPRTIVALTLEKSTLRGGNFWYAKWSSPIFGGEKPELGLQIDMKGELTKVVSGPGETGDGQRRFGAREMR